MASGAGRIDPSRDTSLSIRGHIIPGQVCIGVISIQRVLYQLALSTATGHDITLSIRPPTWEPQAATNLRPCIFLQRTLKGIHVLPLSTFQGHEPETWNLFLREIVVPIGDRSTIRPIFHDRKAFQTEPAWSHREGMPTYIFPEIVVLPLDTPLRRLPAAMSPSMARELKLHCLDITKNLKSVPRASMQLWIKSFEGNPYGAATWKSLIPAAPEEPTDASRQDGVFKSSLNPQAAAFVPRSVCYDAMSFPDLANSSNCGSTVIFGLSTPASSLRSAHTPSIHQALHANAPWSTSHFETDSALRKSLAWSAYGSDKENIDL